MAVVYFLFAMYGFIAAGILGGLALAAVLVGYLFQRRASAGAVAGSP